jgi:hypothetical protein
MVDHREWDTLLTEEEGKAAANLGEPVVQQSWLDDILNFDLRQELSSLATPTLISEGRHLDADLLQRGTLRIDTARATRLVGGRRSCLQSNDAQDLQRDGLPVFTLADHLDARARFASLGLTSAARGANDFSNRV